MKDRESDVRNQASIIAIHDAVDAIKSAILKSQVRAAQAVNQEQLALYFGIGRYVSENSRKGYWGKGVIDSISRLLQTELPGLRGFGPSMIKRMRTFYEEWKEIEGKSLVGSEERGVPANSVIPITELQSDNDISVIRPLQLTAFEKFPLTAFLNISFSHHSMILRYTKNINERMYYIQLVYDQRLKVDDLEAVLKAGAYRHRENLPNNFFKAIPNKQLAISTLQMFKDEYMLDYMNVEDIDASDPVDIDERVIEKEIVMNIKNFIMTFGRAFSYMGHQVHYEKMGHDCWVDLLFFNRALKCLVVVELKKGEFKPGYLGQLTAYLQILNDDEKLSGENPPVGIILCKKADKAFVEYLVQEYSHPMGVATYKTTQDMDERLKSVMPPMEDMQKLFTMKNENSE